MKATRTVRLAQIACAGLLLLAPGAKAEEGGKAISKTSISLGTATPGGGYHVPLVPVVIAVVLAALTWIASVLTAPRRAS